MTSAERQLLEAGAKWFDVEPRADDLERLGRFVDVLATWNARIRLTAERDRRALIEKHVVDSLAVVPHLPPSGTVVDIGSGAGFPGIVLACMRGDLGLALIESRRRRVSFLRAAARSIPLPSVSVLELRAEAAPEAGLSSRAALVVARAVRLDAFLAVAAPLVAPGGAIVAMQTPRTATDAERAGRAHGLRLVARQDYTLPVGASRTLLTFSGARPPKQVC